MIEGLITQRQASTDAYNKYKEVLDKPLGLYGNDMGIHTLNMICGGHVPTDLTTFAARAAMGKCLGYGTKVIMFDGTFKEVQNLKTGDILLGIDGSPNKITSICTGEDELFEIQQFKGISYVVNSCHILSLKSRGNEYYKKGVRHQVNNSNYQTKDSIVNIPLNEYMVKSSRWKKRHKGYKEPCIFPDSNLPIDPYVLGVWLGDGSAGKSVIHKPDIELEHRLRLFCEAEGYELKRYDRKTCPELSIVGKGHSDYLSNRLKSINVFNNKHIPECYLRTSLEKRRALLAGLLDTDGYKTGSGGYEIAQSRKDLAYQIKRLADSLGLHTSIHEKIVNSKTYYRLNIHGNDLNTLPMCIPRKKYDYGRKSVDRTISGFKVIPRGKGEYYGFTLENEDRRFFLEDNTVTHNTAIVTPMGEATLRVLNDKRPELLIASWELTPSKLIDRYVCMKTGLTLMQLKYPKVLSPEMQKLVVEAYREASTLKIHYHPYSTDIETMTRILNEFAEAVHKRSVIEGVKVHPVFVLDFIGRAKGSTKYSSRTYDISGFIYGVKQICNQTGMSAFILAQINRGADSKEFPEIADLSDSAAIEQASDNVIILHRPEHHGIETIKDPRNGIEMPSKGKALFRVVKARETGSCDVVVNCEIAHFRWWDANHSAWNYPYWKLYNDSRFWSAQFGGI